MSTLREAIRLRALELINDAVRSEVIFAQLSVDFIGATGSDLKLVISEMLFRKEIISLNYRINNIEKCILFPVNCDIHLTIDRKTYDWVVPK